MACELEQQSFDDAVTELNEFASAKAEEFQKRAEVETREVSEDLEKDSDLGETIGAAGGGTVGGIFGGPAGAAAGAVIGREVGKLFDVEIEMKRVKFALDLPEFRMERQDLSFDVPQVTMRNRDVIFHTPSVRMKRVKGPPKPEVKCSGTSWRKPIPKCTVRWTDTWFDVPEPFMEEQRIVLGIPEVRMDTTSMALDLPTSTMRTQEISFDIPSIRITSRISEAKEVESKAAELTRRYERESETLSTEVKELSKERLVPRLRAVFDCHRSQVSAQMTAVTAPFDTALASLDASVEQLKARGVPADDDDITALADQRSRILADRATAVGELEKALDQLNAAERQSIDAMIGS